jgi:N-acetylmuramoyl-L-alanine amidase
MTSLRIAARIAAGVAVVALLLGSLAVTVRSASAAADEEIECLAMTIYHEARGESERGQLAVGHVVVNRARSGLFPTSVCDVVRQGGSQRNRCQFSWWCDGRSDRPRDQAALRESLWLAEEIYYGCTVDPTAGALWYHSTAVRPSWAKSFGRGRRIERHVFYRSGSNLPIQIDAPMASRENCSRGVPRRTATLLAGS